MSNTDKFRSHDWEWVDTDCGWFLLPRPAVPVQKGHPRKPRKPDEPIVSAAEIKRRQDAPAEPEPKPAPAPDIASAPDVIADWPPIPKHIQPYVDALLELRKRFEEQRADWGNALKLLKHREETFDAVGSDGGNFEMRAWSAIADGYDVQYAIDFREQVLRSWIDGTARIRPDTSPNQIRKLNYFREAYYDVKKPRTKKSPKPAVSLPDSEVKGAA